VKRIFSNSIGFFIQNKDLRPQLVLLKACFWRTYGKGFKPHQASFFAKFAGSG
jgi:hypothetical protein